MAHPGPEGWLARLNIGRNRRRTVLSLVPMALGLAALLLLWSLDEALRANLTGNFQDTLIGTVQVHRQGFFERPQLTNDLGAADEVVAAVEAMGVKDWSRRLENYVLAVGPGGTSGLMLIALDPQREPRVTRLHRMVGEGDFFGPDPYSVLLGETSARRLGVAVGDGVDLIANDRFGAPVGDTFRVAGIIAGGGFGVDDAIVFAPLATAQELLEMAGRVTTVVMRVPPHRRDPLVAALDARLDGARYEVMGWNDMFPVMEEWVTVQRLFEYFFVGVVLVLVVTAVGNVALVASLGRRREFQVMLAVGQPAAGLRRMLMAESMLLGAMGCGAGLVAGGLVVGLLSFTGVPMEAIVGGHTERYFVDPVLYPRLEAGPALILTALVFTANLLVGLYPAWRAGRLEPLAGARGI